MSYFGSSREFDSGLWMFSSGCSNSENDHSMMSVKSRYQSESYYTVIDSSEVNLVRKVEHDAARSKMESAGTAKTMSVNV